AAPASPRRSVQPHAPRRDQGGDRGHGAGAALSRGARPALGRGSGVGRRSPDPGADHRSPRALPKGQSGAGSRDRVGAGLRGPHERGGDPEHRGDEPERRAGGEAAPPGNGASGASLPGRHRIPARLRFHAGRDRPRAPSLSRRSAAELMPAATARADVPTLLERLRAAHPDAACALAHENPFQLLIATILSAQCTDARVNMVTPGLFAKYPDAGAMSAVSQEELESIIRSTGFYRNKSKAIRAASRRLVEAYGGVVPRSMEA